MVHLRREHISVAFVVCFGAVLSVGLFFLTNRWERARLQTEFDLLSENRAAGLKSSLSNNLEVLHSLREFYASSQMVEHREFRRFVSYPLRRHPELQGLFWIPRVPDSERIPFEESARAGGIQKFRIKERDSEGRLVPAASRSEYFPFFYAEPLETHDRLLGVDLYAGLSYLEAMERARASGRPRALSRAGLIEPVDDPSSSLVFLPVFSQRVSGRHVQGRQEELRGFVAMGFRLSEMAKRSMEPLLLAGIDTYIFEGAKTNEKSLLCYLQSDMGNTGGEWNQGMGIFSDSWLRWKTTLKSAGKQWTVVYLPSSDFWRSHLQWESWMVLVVSVALTMLLGIYLLNLSNRAGVVQQLVAKRTLELSNQTREKMMVTEALRERDLSHRLIIETANDAFVAIDPKGFVIDWNRQAETIFGWSREEAMGRSLAETSIPPFQREAYWKGLSHFLKTGEGSLLNKRIELTALHRGGHEFPVELTAWPIKVGETYRFNAFIRDITERKRLQEMKDEFVSTVSHELRTPLTIIREGVLQVMEGLHGKISERQHQFLSLTLGGVDRLKRIIEDLLDISKIEAGKVTVNRALEDVVSLAREVASGFKKRAEAKGIGLEEDFPHGSIKIYLDKGLYSQVLSNLIDNAVKFTETGSIHISLRDSAQSLICTVSDTGIGISEENMKKVFNKFEQFGRTYGPGEKGTGLGLTICKGLIESHRGKIRIESKPNQGTIIAFEMPKLTAQDVFQEYLSSVLREATKQKIPVSVIDMGVKGIEEIMRKEDRSEYENLLQELERDIKSSLRRHMDRVMNGNRGVLVMLPGTKKEDALKVAERLRQVSLDCLAKEKRFGHADILCRVFSYPDDGETEGDFARLLG